MSPEQYTRLRAAGLPAPAHQIFKRKPKQEQQMHYPIGEPSNVSVVYPQNLLTDGFVRVSDIHFSDPIAEERHASTGQAMRYNTGKAKLSYTPVALLEGASRALVYGAQKYERNNWKRGFPKTEVMDCLLRHAFAWLDGDDTDDESKLHHFDHIAANIAFLLHMEKTGTGTDDRSCSGTA